MLRITKNLIGEKIKIGGLENREENLGNCRYAGVLFLIKSIRQIDLAIDINKNERGKGSAPVKLKQLRK